MDATDPERITLEKAVPGLRAVVPGEINRLSKIAGLDAPLRGPTAEEKAALDDTSKIFERYGSEIAGALLLAVLPDAFAAEEGAKVLADTGQLIKPGALRRRIRGTAQFLILVLAHDYGSSDQAVVDSEDRRWDQEDGRCWRAVVALRLYHAAIRTLANANPPPPPAPPPPAAPPATVINQEDLLGMLLGFSVGTLDVLDRLGIRLSPEEQESYLTAWNYIGTLLGISTPKVLETLVGAPAVPAVVVPSVFATPVGSGVPSLLPTTCAGARQLFDQIRDRVWTHTEGMGFQDLMDSTDDGRRLVLAMIVDLRASMPKPAKELPQLVIRELVQPRVRQRLALGEGGLLELAYVQLLQFIDRSPIGRTFGRGTLTGPGLRVAVNYVTRASMVDFLASEGPPFVIPGLQDWITVLESKEQRPEGAKAEQKRPGSQKGPPGSQGAEPAPKKGAPKKGPPKKAATVGLGDTNQAAPVASAGSADSIPT